MKKNRYHNNLQPTSWLLFCLSKLRTSFPTQRQEKPLNSTVRCHRKAQVHSFERSHLMISSADTITGNYCSVAFIWMLTRYNLVHTFCKTDRTTLHNILKTLPQESTHSVTFMAEMESHLMISFTDSIVRTTICTLWKQYTIQQYIHSFIHSDQWERTPQYLHWNGLYIHD